MIRLCALDSAESPKAHHPFPVVAGDRHHGRPGRRKSLLLIAVHASYPPRGTPNHDRLLPAGTASYHRPRPLPLPLGLRPRPAVGAGGQPQVPQREGGRGRRGRGRGRAPAAVHAGGGALRRHARGQVAAEARGCAGQAQAEVPQRRLEVPPQALHLLLSSVTQASIYSHRQCQMGDPV